MKIQKFLHLNMQKGKTITVSYSDSDLEKISDSWLKKFESENYKGLAETVVHDFVKQEAKKIIEHFQNNFGTKIKGSNKMIIAEPTDPTSFLITFCGLILGKLKIQIQNPVKIEAEFFPVSDLGQFFTDYGNKKEGA